MQSYYIRFFLLFSLDRVGKGSAFLFYCSLSVLVTILIQIFKLGIHYTSRISFIFIYFFVSKWFV